MKLLHEPTDTTSENYLWKEFQFIVISSKKIRKFNSSSLTHSLGWILAGTMVNLGQWPIITSQRSDFSWVMLGHIEKTPPVSVICNAVKAEILFQNSAYNLATYFTVHLVMAISTKQTTRMLNLYQTTKLTLIL